MTLRRVNPEGTDPQLISEWMQRPHLAESWEQPWSEERWREDARARIAGTYSSPCILGYAGREVGYLEIYRSHRDEIGAFYPSKPHDLACHIAVAELDLLGRGLFPPFIKDLIDKLFAADPQCNTLAADPDHRNPRVHRALEKAGVTTRRTVAVRNNRTIILWLVNRDSWNDDDT
ncbi:acetyltransferase [Corynebacterium sp. TAE3-ERU12]|uniref:GNAT family N-acetyltransferase n=1 Tax=Corynebacterium sp. TAE3-ERU12 TaxID=2849491 RepID=UPI001C4773E9|nr:GNAT family N-acetyltransferase [Corynebacterium sp. TAE3-ERU12]MBV7294655.1 acetyltransferase [Corynebacterium sp. TAE3-ERU12]